MTSISFIDGIIKAESYEDILNNVAVANELMRTATSTRAYEEAKAIHEYWNEFAGNVLAVAEADTLDAEASEYHYITNTSEGNISLVFKGNMYSIHRTASGNCLFGTLDRDEFIEKLAHYYIIEIAAS